MRSLTALLILIPLLAACVARRTITRPEQGDHRLQNIAFEREIRKYGRPGDWLVTRGYRATDDLVVNATGIPLSHAAVYDPENDQVIEAEGKGVHATPLPKFVDKSHRIILIRPRWSTTATRAEATKVARSLIGEDYDFLGTIGFDVPSRYYCSELAVDIYRKWHSPSDHLPTVIKPGTMYLWGRVLYDSRPRN